MRTLILSLSLLLVLAGPAPAEPVENIAELKDFITGTISVPGESLSVVLSAPAGTKLVLKAKKLGKEDPGITLRLQAPDGSDLELVKNKAILTASGQHRITMTAGVGLTGMFTLKIRGKPPTKAKFTELMEADDTDERLVPFAVLPETRINYKLTKADPTFLYGPEGYELELFSRKERGLLLQAGGDYELGLKGAMVNGKAGKARAQVKLIPPEIVRRKLWLSNSGFGEAPVIESIEPAEGLSTRPVEGVIVSGGPFEAAVTAELSRNGLVIPVDVFWTSEDEIQISADITGAKAGGWDLIVRNPSGASAQARFRVIKPDNIVLPDGIEAGTEIWYLDFNDAFTQDLFEFGLSKTVGAGGSKAVNQHVRTVMKAYVLYWLRSYFGLSGTTGTVTGANVPISFIVQDVPGVAGTAGVDYNRIEIGGTALLGAKSDNPVLNWGHTPVDVDNGQIDDISGGGAEEATARVPVYEMRPSNVSQSTTLWRQTFTELLANPVADTDAGLFSSDPKWFLNRDDANIARYKIIVPTIEILSKEIAAVAAHHIARAMGLSNGSEGVMSLPVLYGEFASTGGLGFTEDELADLRVLANPILLPGNSNMLRMKPFQLNPGQPSIVTIYGGLVNQERSFYPTGGRPDRLPEDMRYQIAYNSTPPLGVTWPNSALDGLMRASPPLRVDGFWYTDAVFFRVTATDIVDGSVSAWNHRVNVLVDTTSLSGTELGAALLLNRQVTEGPAR